jgi:hypothetical protein
MDPLVLMQIPELQPADPELNIGCLNQNRCRLHGTFDGRGMVSCTLQWGPPTGISSVECVTLTLLTQFDGHYISSETGTQSTIMMLGQWRVY